MRQLTGREEEDDTGCKPALGTAQYSPHACKGAGRLAARQADGDGAPDEHERGEVSRWSDTRKEHVAGYLGDAVAYWNLRQACSVGDV